MGGGTNLSARTLRGAKGSSQCHRQPSLFDPGVRGFIPEQVPHLESIAAFAALTHGELCCFCCTFSVPSATMYPGPKGVPGTGQVVLNEDVTVTLMRTSRNE